MGGDRFDQVAVTNKQLCGSGEAVFLMEACVYSVVGAVKTRLIGLEGFIPDSLEWKRAVITIRRRHR